MENFITVNEAAAILQVDRVTIYNYFKAGKLTKYKPVPHQTRIDPSEVKALIEINEEPEKQAQ